MANTDLNYEEGISFLRQNDQQFEDLYQQLGFLKQRKRSISFSSFVSTIIGQQLSGKAADTIYRRLLEKVHDKVTPENIGRMTISELRSIGISNSKSSYISELSKMFLEKKFKIAVLKKLSDIELYNELLKIRGIGPWSAKIIMLFNFQRLNAFPFGDGTLERAFPLLWDLDLNCLPDYVDKWSPYSGIVAMYMWSYIDKD